MEEDYFSKDFNDGPLLTKKLMPEYEKIKNLSCKEKSFEEFKQGKIKDKNYLSNLYNEYKNKYNI